MGATPIPFSEMSTTGRTGSSDSMCAIPILLAAVVGAKVTANCAVPAGGKSSDAVLYHFRSHVKSNQNNDVIVSNGLN